MNLRETFWTALAALVFGLMNLAVLLWIAIRTTWDTLVLGKDASEQLRRYDDDLNGQA